jgi:hypothetical protein
MKNDKAKQTEEDVRILNSDLRESLDTLPEWIGQISERLSSHSECENANRADLDVLTAKTIKARVDFCTLDGKRAISINGLIAQVENFRLLRDLLTGGHDVKFAPVMVGIQAG